MADPFRHGLTRGRLRPPDPGHPLVHRTALISDWHDRDPRVALITGPAGYGKTTLAAQYVAARTEAGLGSAWLTLDRQDDDAETLVRHLVYALTPHLADREVSRMHEILNGQAESAPVYAMSLLTDALEDRGEPLLVTIDDAHHATSEASTRALSALLHDAPRSTRFVLTARARPALTWSRIRLAGDLLEIGATELLMDDDQSREVLGLEATDDTGALIHQAQGWVVALRMMSLSLHSGANPTRLVGEAADGGAGDLHEFLAENVVSTLTDDTVAFLEDLSVCDRLSIDLAVALTGRADAEELLNLAVEQAVFLSPSDRANGLYVMHYLFRTHLSERLRRRDPARWRLVLERAVTWYAEHGHHEEAFEHAALISDEAAADLVESVAMDLFEHSAMSTIIRLADRVPAPIKESRWRLLLAVGWANSLLQRSTIAELHLDLCRAAIPASAATPEVLAEMDVLQAVIDIVRDRMDRVQSLVRPALEGDFSPFVRGVGANANTVALLHAQRFPEALDQQRRAQAFHLRCRGPFAAIYGRAYAGYTALESADLDTAQAQFDAALDLASQSSDVAAHGAQLARVLRGELWLERGEDEAARHVFEDARAFGAGGGTVDVLRTIFGTFARAWYRNGDREAALTLVQEGIDHATRLDLPRLVQELTLDLVRMRLESGDTPGAAAAVRAAERTPGAADAGAMTLSRALVSTAQGRHAEAIGALERADRREEHWSPRRRLTLHAQLAVALDRGGRPRQADRVCADTVLAAAAAGAVDGLRAAGPGLAPLLQRLPADVLESAGVADLLRRVSIDAASETADPRPARAAAPPVDRPGQDAGATPRIVDLNERELEVMGCLEAGMANREIAQQLGVSVNTVKWHLKNINTKLGSTSRLSAISVFRDHCAGTGP